MEGPEEDDEMQWTGMLWGCFNAETGKMRQRIEMPGSGRLKRPRPKLDCSAVEEEKGVCVSDACILRIYMKVGQ